MYSEILKSLQNVSDAKKLRLLDFFYADRVEEAHRNTQQRVKLLSDIVNLAENGVVAIVNSGCDCDMASWTNSVSYVDATKKEVLDWIERFYDNAEGPQSFYLEKPSIAKQLHSYSRDLAMEAFEDGHQHVIYS